MPSTIRGSNNFDTAGGNAVKAWVNFNGTGTVAIRASFNVTSITDNGTGNYTVNFTTAMTDANYAAIASTSNATVPRFAGAVERTTTTARIVTQSQPGAAFDLDFVDVAIFR